jgi:hypothetical protein
MKEGENSGVWRLLIFNIIIYRYGVSFLRLHGAMMGVAIAELACEWGTLWMYDYTGGPSTGKLCRKQDTAYAATLILFIWDPYFFSLGNSN